MSYMTLSVDLPCPLCNACLTATLERADQDDGSPGWLVTDLWGCPHAEDLVTDPAIVEAAIDAGEQALIEAKDDALDAQAREDSRRQDEDYDGGRDRDLLR